MAVRQDAEIVRLWQSSCRAWTKLAVAYLDFKEHRRWEELGFRSLDAWRNDRGITRSVFYQAVSLAAKLKDLPAEALAKVPKANAYQLQRLPESKRRDPELLAKAQVETEEQFTKRVELLMPGDHHERHVRRSLSLPPSLAEQWDEAMRAAGMLLGTDAPEACVELILRRFMESPWDDEKADSQTVEEAMRNVAKLAEMGVL